MSKRTDFIDSLVDRFKDQATYDYWRSVADYLDKIGVPPFESVQGFVAEANNQWRDRRIKDYETYSAIYNMSIGMAYDEEGDPYITNEDYEEGLVDIKIYDPTYQGDFADFSLMAKGLAGNTWLLRETIKWAVEQEGGSVLSIDVKATETRRIWFLPLEANYAVRVFYHGSPIIITLPLVIWAAVIALAAVSIIVGVWRFTDVAIEREQTRKLVATQEVNKELLKIAQDPTTQPDTRRQIIDTVSKSQVEVARSLNVPKTPFAGIGNIVKYGFLGLGLILAFQAFQAIRPIRRHSE